jgi:hypothetical protein
LHRFSPSQEARIHLAKEGFAQNYGKEFEKLMSFLVQISA